ncbi:hypothetical protein P691DRAFT_854947 [Macrolepiota fuliginosa MF-IS2]|uniref:Uncharacterized protein n=1 Tax=Macrolepiota fuliginosa MF-IS2 TaxID=1400762 RepID=A0A9P5XDQ9_9AGAR|nr:hypothetical protein P691DRAFT_854947 [Macrolepiota fuliginosa MF-IS2]
MNDPPSLIDTYSCDHLLVVMHQQRNNKHLRNYRQKRTIPLRITGTTSYSVTLLFFLILGQTGLLLPISNLKHRSCGFARGASGLVGSGDSFNSRLMNTVVNRPERELSWVLLEKTMMLLCLHKRDRLASDIHNSGRGVTRSLRENVVRYPKSAGKGASIGFLAAWVGGKVFCFFVANSQEKCGAPGLALESWKRYASGG